MRCSATAAGIACCAASSRSRAGAAEQVGDRGDAALYLALPQAAEAEYERRRRGLVAEAVVAHRIDAHGPLRRDRRDLLLVGTVGERHDRVEARRQAAQLDARRMACERVHQRLAAGGVDRSHAAQVAVVAAGLDQRRERKLVEHGESAIVVALLDRDRVRERGRADDPAEPQRRRERLADRSERRDAFRAQPLERADRLAVVAELGVVVVLDQPCVVLGRPRHERLAALGREQSAGRRLVRGRQHGCVAAGGR